MRKRLYFLFLSLILPISSFGGDCTSQPYSPGTSLKAYVYTGETGNNAYICETGHCDSDKTILLKNTFRLANYDTAEHKPVPKKVDNVAREQLSGGYWLLKCNHSPGISDSDNANVNSATNWDYVNDVSECNSSDINSLKYTGYKLESSFLYGKSGDNGSFHDVCKLTESTEMCGLKCDIDNHGKSYIFGCSAANAFEIKQCFAARWTDKGTVEKSCYSYTEFGVHPAGKPANYDAFGKPYASSTNGVEDKQIYVNGTGDPNYREYDENKVCTGCAGDYKFMILHGNKTISCYKDENEAECMWKKESENEQVEWKQDASGNSYHCECTEQDQEWDTNRKVCVEKKYGFACTSDRVDESYIFMDGTENEYIPWKCNENGKWKQNKKGKELTDCYEVSGITGVATYTKPDGYTAGHGTSLNLYVKTDLQPNHQFASPDVKVYKYDTDKDKMCKWCAVGKNVTLSEKNKLGCYGSADQAWCDFKKYKDNLDVRWKDGACVCTGLGMEWDPKIRECVNRDCAKFSNGSGARKCCLASNATWQGSEADGNCICHEEAYEWKNDKCTFMPEQKEKLEAARNKLNAFLKSADENASVWRDAAGKFNAVRLASDLTAGVVLGTVGGVVSGVVIKKKQVEKGFEVLHCDVGGQKMANWGDEFRIGLQSKY